MSALIHNNYEYLRIKTEPRSWPKVIAGLAKISVPEIEARGGVLFGLWISQIGLPMNEGVLLVAWPQQSIPDGGACSAVLAASTQVTAVEAQPLIAAVKPAVSGPPQLPGVYMHRWFGVAESDWDEFLQLSQAAWPDFEAESGASVLGFWRRAEKSSEQVHALLITRYPNMAAWEASRGENARTREAEQAWEAFVRRHQLTQSMQAASMELILPEEFLSRHK